MMSPICRAHSSLGIDLPPLAPDFIYLLPTWPAPPNIFPIWKTWFNSSQLHLGSKISVQRFLKEPTFHHDHHTTILADARSIRPNPTTFHHHATFNCSRLLIRLLPFSSVFMSTHSPNQLQSGILIINSIISVFDAK